MNNQLAKIENEITSALIINGDLSRLPQEQKVLYYKQYCERLGLDPFTQPFKILKLNGKEVLYCDRSGTQQLNKLHNVSHEVKGRENIGGCYVVTARAFMPDGRTTDSIGAVNIEGLKGDALCNAMMKAETKAKRRATLDLLGLGILDETETETIPNAQVINFPQGEQPEEEKANDSQLAYIEGLVHTCSLDENYKSRIESKLLQFTKSEAEKTIEFLKKNQVQSLDQQFNEAIRRD